MRLIDADAFFDHMEEIRQECSEEDTLSSDFMAQIIEIVQDEYLANAQTVDAVPAVHGHWVDRYEIKSFKHTNIPTVQCSECECYFCDIINNHKFMYHYCPNCGAKMEAD